ncbi:MAG: translocation/assembly module TamB domain-containing protein [Acidobacteria bacterium]|nr:translocation/assembly module TamB domain-containing protein [Acidobacteriota bacterium]
MRFRPLFRRRFVLATAVLAAAGLLGILLLHAPFVRAAALRYAVRVVEERYGLRVAALRLDYNLAALRLGLAGLRVSAIDSPDDPFVIADYVSVTLPWRAVSGDLRFLEIGAMNARILVRLREDGTSNLPRASQAPGGEPAPLRVARIDIPQLAIDIRNERTGTFLWMPAIALRLTPGADGYVRFGAPAQFYNEAQLTRISHVDGAASFDGRALHLANLQVRADEGSAQLDGAISLLAREPSLNLHARGSVNVTRLTRWVVVNGELPRGDVMFEVDASGALDRLETRVNVASATLAWQGITASDLAARAVVTSSGAALEELTGGFGGGRVTASGRIPSGADGDGRIAASIAGVDAAAATLALAPEAGVVPAGRLSGDLEAAGRGADLARWSASARLAMTAGRNARGRLALSGDAAVALNEGRWRLDGHQVVGGVAKVTVALSGTLDHVIDGTAHVDETDLPDLVRVLRTTGIADAGDVLERGSLEADVRVAGRVEDPTVEAHAVVHRVLASQIDVALLQAEVTGRPLASRLEFQITAPEAVVAEQALRDVQVAGRLTNAAGPRPASLVVIDEAAAKQPDAGGSLRATGTYNLVTDQFTASAEGSQWRLTPTADRPVSGAVDVRVTGEGTREQPSGNGSLVVRDARWREVALGRLDASVELDGRAASIMARAPEFAATASGRIVIDAPYQTTFEAHAEALDLSRFTPFVQIPAAVTGTTTFSAHGDLALQAWRRGAATLDVAVLEAKVGDLAVDLAAPARLRYEDERAHIERLDVAAGDMSISATGSLPVFDPATDAPAVLLTATGNIDEVIRAAMAAGVFEDSYLGGGSGPVALLARVTGTVQRPEIAADLDVGPGSLALQDGPPVTGVRVRAHAEDGWLELREGVAAYEGARLAVTGRAPLSLLTGQPGPAGDADVHARATTLTPAVLSPFAEPGTLDEVTGSVDVSLDATTATRNLADLTGELRIDRFDLRVADLPVTQRVPTRLVARDGFARVEAWEWVGQGATLAVRGQVRLEDRQAAILANGVVDLRLLTPFLRGAGLSTAGRLEPRLSITGPIDSPRVDGDLLVSDGELRLSDPRVLVSDLTVRTVLTRTTARITTLAGSVNGGALTGSGTIDYGAVQGLEAQLSADIKGMALDYPPGLRSELDASLELQAAESAGPRATALDASGTRPTYAGELSGTVTVLRGAYREPLAVVTGLLAGLRARRLAATGEPSALLDALVLDVRVVTDEDVFVDNNYGRFQIGGDLRVAGTAAAPVLSGRAELREGGQLFVGRNVYTVGAGAIDFANPVAIEPTLNVEASTRAGGEEIQVAITGPAESPTVDLRSTSSPDLGQAELASLLLTGRRLEDLTPGDAAFVGTQVLGNFSAEVLGFASRAVGLDTLRLGGVENTAVRRDPTAVATELDPTTRVTFGKSLGPDVDVTFSQSLRESAAQTWIVDYLPARGLELRLVSDDKDLRSYGFRHDVAFGGGLRAGEPAGRPPRREAARVTGVDVSGELALPEARVRDTLRLRPGARFDFARWQADRDRLDTLYRSEGYLTARVTARRLEAAAGIALSYVIAAGPATRIAATGIDLDPALRSRLETAWVQSVFDEFLIDEARQVVRDHLGRRGYLQPSIDARVREDGATRTLELAVDPGVRTMQTAVRIDGAPERLAADIMAQLGRLGLADRALGDPGGGERATADSMRAEGYARARVRAGAPLFAGATATLPVTVDAGAVVTISSLTFDGAALVTRQALGDATALREGMPYDPAALEDARDRLTALYRREGFAAATVGVRGRLDPGAPLVDVTFAIQEGPRQTLHEVVIAGNRAIDSDVILRALALPLDEPLRAADVLQARSRVSGTGLFRRVDVASETVEPAAAGVAPVRLRVTVEEWPALRLRYGFVVAEERPGNSLEHRELVPGVSADLTRRTLFGRAMTVGTAIGLQRREQRGRAFLNTPTFLGLPIESSLIGERSREEFQSASLVTSRTSATWEQRTRVARSLSLSYAYTFERNHTFDTKPTDSGGLAFDLTINIARLNAAAAWDTRDDPTDTTRGLFTSSTVEFAPEMAGSDIRFVRQLQQAYYFRPWRSAVFASAARFGVVVPLGGQELIPSERFFAGGSRSVRGVAEGTLGGRDFFGDATGGRAMIVVNQEVRLPIYRWVRGVGFIDAGNVFTRPGDASLRDLVGSLGVGVRLATPFALLRADYAKTMWGLPAASTRWTFGIGQAF